MIISILTFFAIVLGGIYAVANGNWPMFTIVFIFALLDFLHESTRDK